MTGFTTLTGKYVPLDRANIDTDIIIPKQFLQTTKSTGFGDYLFYDWRFKNGNSQTPDPDFILNNPLYKNAEILLTEDNFGCGSSREYAPWALRDYGFRAVIAPSFADIFYNNALNTGILPIRLGKEEIKTLFNYAHKAPQTQLTIDLPQQTVTVENGPTYHFEIDPFRKDCLVKGLDNIDLTLQISDEISDYENRAPSFL